MAINDPGIKDTCLYMEAFVGDGGVHTDPNAQYWLSEDIVMTTTADESKAVIGANTTVVTVRCKAGQGCPPLDQQGGATTPAFQLFVCPPSLNIGDSFQLPSNTKGGTGQTLAVTGGVIAAPGFVKTTVPWTGTAANLDAGGDHVCLVARCFPVETSSPDTSVTGLSDHLPNDQHYAQRNLLPVPAEGGGKKKIQIRTGNARLEPQLVLIQAVADLRPSRQVLGAILPSLQLIPGFKQVATEPLAKIQFDFSNFGKHKEGIWQEIREEFDKVEDAVEEFFGGHDDDKGKIHAQVKIKPNFFSTFDFIADLSRAQRGNGYVYHLTQTLNGQPDGGITVVVVAI